jgi:hypothetical protein
MVKSNEEPEEGLVRHPYWYARLLGVFHVNVFPPGARSPRRVEFLWVRWFGRDPEWDSGPNHLRLDRIGYVPETDAEAFGFLDPSLVLRACHLVPAFALGKTASLLARSAARDFHDGDWLNYYVMRWVSFTFTVLPSLISSRFVDRDMMMRHLGIGVGHLQPPDFPTEVDTDFQALIVQFRIPDDAVPPDNLVSLPDTAGDPGTTQAQPIHAEDIESEDEEGDVDGELELVQGDDDDEYIDL